MAERRNIRLDDTNVVAAAQILSWLAFPRRPEHGIDLLNQWYWVMARMHGNSTVRWPGVTKKLNRLDSQLGTFEARLGDAVRAGSWFETGRLTDAVPSPMARMFATGTRMMARRQARLIGYPDVDEASGNLIRKIWTPRKSMLHLALGFNRAIAAEIENGQRMPGVDLAQIFWTPTWVPAAIDHAERQAALAAKLGKYDLNKFVRFHRDP